MRIRKIEELNLKKYIVLIIGILTCLLIACENNINSNTAIVKAEEGDLTAKEFTISYNTLVYTPNVLINQLGYSAENKKVAYFIGEDLSEIFQVYEYGTDLVVYEGTIEPTIEEGYYVGDFTELKKQGTYYIQTEKIGESYPFKIDEQLIMEDIYRKLISNLSNQNPAKYKDIEKIEELFPSLIAHEMYPTAFFDGDIYMEPNKIPDILDYLELVGQSILESDESIESVENRFLEAAFFGKLAYNFMGYDQIKAKEYQTIAENQYKEAKTLLRAEESITGYESIAYFASAELYRGTGKYTYRIDTEKYGSSIPYVQEQNAFTFYADMTHMSTRRTVRVGFCNDRMDKVRGQVIAWTENNGEYPFFYPSENTNTLLLYGMKTLWLHEINYSEEYEMLEQEIYAYFTGLNTEGVSYVSEIGYTKSKDIFEKRLDLNNQFLVLISRYMQQEEVE